MILGLGAASRLATTRMEEFCGKTGAVRDYFETKLTDEFGDAVRIHFRNSNRLCNTSSVAFVNLPSTSRELLAKCEHCFIAASGSACHANSTR